MVGEQMKQLNPHGVAGQLHKVHVHSTGDDHKSDVMSTSSRILLVLEVLYYTSNKMRNRKEGCVEKSYHKCDA